ncbi:DUF5752 family protein [Thermodesulfovibrio yellowstonii]|uniref:Mechanosensitive ion channel MscS domain-containing protein n=1 Tax=Thermodesulfovibrio yellowstonii TaxID=28262 RepID=A0A9W6LJF0_9BACT|nr:DUF5752 family protein [Thermodesulfovibrio islandicus]GLI52459.1 hypothetical protein TISLANDTSLP1_01520 [Thermodesulfovibrio islandicus]
MYEWFEKNWFSIIVPLIVCISFIIVAFWIRFRLFEYLKFKTEQIKWIGKDILIKNLIIMVFYWILILGVYTAIELSSIKGAIYVFLSRFLISVFFISLIYPLYRITNGIINLYSDRVKKPLVKAFQNLKTALSIIFIVIGILIMLEIWKFPTTPFILFFIMGSAILFIVFKDELANLISGFEIINGEIIRKGDHIKLESGEEGTVHNVTWRHVQIKSLEEKIILIPTSKFIKFKIEIHRKPLKRAKEPFRFYTRLSIKELTGLKAKNLKELLIHIKEVPNSVIFYHTHDFIEEYHYLTPQPSNEFALWVGNALGYGSLSEKLSTIDIFEFSSIGELRRRLIDILEEYINTNPVDKNCDEGEEFHFIKSVSSIMPTPYIAHDLREFLQILKFISSNSLFFHMYEARLRLGRLVNDFSLWISENLHETELAESINSIDLYMYTIEGIREKLIFTIENYIEKEVAIE